MRSAHKRRLRGFIWLSLICIWKSFSKRKDFFTSSRLFWINLLASRLSFFLYAKRNITWASFFRLLLRVFVYLIYSVQVYLSVIGCHLQTHTQSVLDCQHRAYLQQCVQCPLQINWQIATFFFFLLLITLSSFHCKHFEIASIDCHVFLFVFFLSFFELLAIF